MPIGNQLKKNIGNSTSKYEQKQTEFKKNLVSFHQNHREQEYAHTQKAMRAMTQKNNALHVEKRY